jgi:prefoldin subunit 5
MISKLSELSTNIKDMNTAITDMAAMAEKLQSIVERFKL